ncbi:hypothetical protein HMPREF0373_02855 [Eubacterium ramulus ATCC 29099]|uniref:Uncharacterized protein n=1 Tax=Eubacterium ramulus ATCC 29099 TaxID=1256908 RepID=U2PFG7_EUBRA|nr:hypothetical protein HMPREF0373_02855 [Eubacterium ramulus ATCC 29099]
MYLFYVCQSFLFYIINFSSHTQNIYTIKTGSGIIFSASVCQLQKK